MPLLVALPGRKPQRIANKLCLPAASASLANAPFAVTNVRIWENSGRDYKLRPPNTNDAGLWPVG